MDSETVAQQPLSRYGFNVYRDGELVREQVVEARNSVAAELAAGSYIDPSSGEYLWYSQPRWIA
jgi:hypothetical protein